MSVYNRDLCVGCGSCGLGCPSGALHLEPVSEEEWVPVCSSFQDGKRPGLRIWEWGSRNEIADCGFMDCGYVEVY